MRKEFSIILTFSLLLALSFCFAPQAKATENIVINEIAWMGSATSANDEWIELYNSSPENIKIDGWILKTTDDGIKINLKGEIPAMEFFLLERTDDTSVPNVKADLIYQGALSNNGEILRLIDSNNNIIDEVNCSAGWLSGDNKAKQTMERIPSAGTSSEPQPNSSWQAIWQTSQNPGGTPRVINSIKLPPKADQPLAEIDNESTTTNQIAEQEVMPSSLPVNYPGNIFLSEILPSPEGSDTENEFIEIFNANNFEANISGFKIKDKVGAVKTFTVPVGTKISANGFLAFKSSQTKISLNNTGDGVELLDPTGKLIDSTDFGKSSQGQSWSKGETGWSWSVQTTPNKINIIEQPKTATTTLGITQNKSTPALAQAQNAMPKNKPIVATIIAVVIASGSAAIAWQIKKKSQEI